MLQSIRRVPALPRVSSAHLFALAVGLTFGWLLISEQIPPIVIYLAQLFLMF